MAWVFQWSLDGTANLLIEQLEIVKAKGFAVQVSLDPPCQAKLELSLLTPSEESYPHRRLRAVSCSENTSPKRACNREEFSGSRNLFLDSSRSVSQLRPRPQPWREFYIILKLEKFDRGSERRCSSGVQQGPWPTPNHFV